MTPSSIDRADVRELAEVMRRECQKAMSCNWQIDLRYRFAASLLAVLDECERKRVPVEECQSPTDVTDDIIRAAARAYGTTMDAGEREG